MWRTLTHHDIDPARQRTSVTWTQFLRSQAAVACDFVTVDTALLRRCYLLLFIDITNREALYGGITAEGDPVVSPADSNQGPTSLPAA